MDLNVHVMSCSGFSVVFFSQILTEDTSIFYKVQIREYFTYSKMCSTVQIFISYPVTSEKFNFTKCPLVDANKLGLLTNVTFTFTSRQKESSPKLKVNLIQILFNLKMYAYNLNYLKSNRRQTSEKLAIIDNNMNCLFLMK